MYVLEAEHSFDSAHFLAGYEGKCSNIHGHRWRVVVTVQSDELINSGHLDGMIVDFKDLKHDIKKEVDAYDHALIIERNSLKDETLKVLKNENFSIIEVGFRPTAENFSKHFFDKFLSLGHEVKTVRVYETPTNCATFER